MFFAPTLHRRAYAPAARAFDRNFERFLTDAFLAPAQRGMKVQQDEKAWTITLDLPGVAREQLAVDIEGAVVRIETKAEAKRQFKAAYELPEEIDADASTAPSGDTAMLATCAVWPSSTASGCALSANHRTMRVSAPAVAMRPSLRKATALTALS